MVSSEVSHALRRLGMDAEATTIYEALLELGPAPLLVIEAACGLAPDEFRTAYDGLVEAGLANAGGVDDVVAPLPPAATLEVMGRRRTAEIDESRIAVTTAFDAFRRARSSGSTDDLVEVVTGAEIGPRMQQVWRSAQHLIRQLDSPPYFQVPGGVEDAMETLGRGVAQRMVYARESLVFPGKLADDIDRCIAAGEEARVVTSVPVKTIVIDDRLATIAPAIGDADVYNTMLVVQPGPLLTAIIALFESIWNSAVPFHDRVTDSPRLLPADRKLFALLAGGLSDDEIAAELDISRRTLYRRLEVLGARLGASTRFQMALQAQRRGWV